MEYALPRRPCLFVQLFADFKPLTVVLPRRSFESQLEVLRAYSAARSWSPLEFVDHGVSGAKASRPALDALLVAARARKLDILAVTKLDRLARSTHQLVTLAKELEALGVDLVVLDQMLDSSLPAGRLLFHVLSCARCGRRGRWVRHVTLARLRPRPVPRR